MEKEMLEAVGEMRRPVPLPLAMAYVPPQKWTEVYDKDQALAAGTLFPALDLPFKGGVR